MKTEYRLSMVWSSIGGYVGKLYAKEVVLLNFPHESGAEAMERLIEMLVHTEDVL